MLLSVTRPTTLCHLNLKDIALNSFTQKGSKDIWYLAKIGKDILYNDNILKVPSRKRKEEREKVNPPQITKIFIVQDTLILST